MPERSDEAEHWFNAVYEAVQQIPKGKVTTYGHIARLLGYPQRARQVGICLKHLPSAGREEEGSQSYFNGGNVPWQRVINAKGEISPREPGAADRQAQELRAEGVEVTWSVDAYVIDLKEYGWFPEEVDID